MLSGRDQNDKTPLSKRIFDDMVRHIMTLARTIAPMPHLDSRVSHPRTLGDVLDFTINTTMHGKSGTHNSGATSGRAHSTKNCIRFIQDFFKIQ